MSREMCKKCRDTGLLPFVKNGKIIPNAFVHCSCHPNYGDNPWDNGALATDGRRPPGKPSNRPHKQRLYINDFDFPMSQDFYLALCEYHGWSQPLAYSPQISKMPPRLQEPEIHKVVYEHSDMSERNLRRLESQERQLTGIKQILNDMVKKETSKNKIKVGSDEVNNREDITDRLYKKLY